MKVRMDYVTNSSSSSFILARKEELSQQQKDVIVDFVVKRMLGDKVASSREELDQYMEEYWVDDRKRQEMQEVLDKGLCLFSGSVSFEGENEIAFLLNDLWKAIEQADSSSFVGIDTSLDY